MFFLCCEDWTKSGPSSFIVLCDIVQFVFYLCVCPLLVPHNHNRWAKQHRQVRHRHRPHNKSHPMSKYTVIMVVGVMSMNQQPMMGKTILNTQHTIYTIICMHIQFHSLSQNEFRSIFGNILCIDISKFPIEFRICYHVLCFWLYVSSTNRRCHLHIFI